MSMIFSTPVKKPEYDESMIFVIDDDAVMARCIARACEKASSDSAAVKKAVRVRIFSNALTAMAALDEGELPQLIFLDILLDGPDGFTFLNELVSYADTARIPVVVVSSLDFTGKDLSAYNVVGVLDKSVMRPEEATEYVKRYVTNVTGAANEVNAAGVVSVAHEVDAVSTSCGSNVIGAMGTSYGAREGDDGAEER